MTFISILSPTVFSFICICKFCTSNDNFFFAVFFFICISKLCTSNDVTCFNIQICLPHMIKTCNSSHFLTPVLVSFFPQSSSPS
ncbi:hypothetical protein CDL12_11068 [Handroanthus impetiginosus]|uniref:Uncharacterized protein n=1 Tax=Handroanthus impetiginosus TaxID=429701 RepID=A0A2G9HFH5_9LAMI|nr:hypothetical protein CDL12_11068 [Handroanthus impetiginosus]